MQIKSYYDFSITDFLSVWLLCVTIDPSSFVSSTPSVSITIWQKIDRDLIGLRILLNRCQFSIELWQMSVGVGWILTVLTSGNSIEIWLEIDYNFTRQHRESAALASEIVAGIGLILTTLWVKIQTKFDRGWIGRRVWSNSSWFLTEFQVVFDQILVGF